MKKIYIALTVLATVTLVSCEREKSFNELTPLGENDIAFFLKGASTRSAVLDSPTAVQGVVIPMGTDNQGNSLFLEETIEELNPSPATKGTPAYTVNVGTLYTTMGVYAEDLGAADYQVMDMYDHKGDPSDPNAPMTAGPDANARDGWRYHYNYSRDPWPDESTPVDFYFNMPASPTGVSITDRSDKQITFDYSSPLTGKAQQDILFSQATYSKKQHKGYLPNGAPVLMYHALTGVKFRTGHENNNPTKTIITKVVIKGLKSTGTATFTGSDFEWNVGNTTANFTQEFKNQAWSADPGVDGTVGTTGSIIWNNDLSSTNWTSAAADKNLNDENGSLTFWFIPQEIDENVTMEVTFRVKTQDTQTGEEITHKIDFGEKMNEGRDENVIWKAGQLRTYTLKPYDVAVEIFDDMTGLKKSDLHVTNTGNVDEYVRMMVIGNWYGWETEEDYQSFLTTKKPEPDIMVGYTTASGSNVMVKPWFREDAVYGQYFDDSFKGGLPAAGRTDWVVGTGSYFYFTEKIGPGEVLNDESQDSATKPLFESYTLPADMIPTIYIPIATSNVRVPAWGVHLKMEVVVQAIGTTAPDGTEYETCWDAWSAALGYTVAPKTQSGGNSSNSGTETNN